MIAEQHDHAPSLPAYIRPSLVCDIHPTAWPSSTRSLATHPHRPHLLGRRLAPLLAASTPPPVPSPTRRAAMAFVPPTAARLGAHGWVGDRAAVTGEVPPPLLTPPTPLTHSATLTPTRAEPLVQQRPRQPIKVPVVVEKAADAGEST